MLNKISKNLSRQHSIKQVYYSDDEDNDNEDDNEVYINRQASLNRQSSFNRQTTLNRQASLSKQQSKYNISNFNSSKINYGVNLNDPKPFSSFKYEVDEDQLNRENNKKNSNSLQRVFLIFIIVYFY